MTLSRKTAGVAAGALMAALLVPVTLAPPAMSSTDFIWQDAVELGSGDRPVIAAQAKTGSSRGQTGGFAVAWNDSNVVKLRFLDVTADTPAWTPEVSLSSGCTSVGQPAIAMQDDSIAVAWSCDDTIQLATVAAGSTLDDSLIQDIAADAKGDPQVVTSYRSVSGDLLYQGVSWVADGGSGDDTAMLAGIEAGRAFIDDSVFEMGSGTDVFLTRSAVQPYYIADSRGVGFVVDDSIQGAFFDAFNLSSLGGASFLPVRGTFATDAGIGDDTSVEFAYTEPSFSGYPAVTWVTSDDSVVAATGKKDPTTGNWDASQATRFVLDDSSGTSFASPTSAYGVDGSNIRLASTYLATTGSAGQAILAVDDSTPSSRTTTLTTLGSTSTAPVSFVSADPTETNGLRGIFAAWAEDDTSLQTRWFGPLRQSGDPMSAIDAVPAVGAVQVALDDTTHPVTSLAGAGSTRQVMGQFGLQDEATAALVWVQNAKVYVSTLTPATPPDPNPPNPGPAPTPATPPSAPSSAETSPGPSEVTVSWTAPASQGSFPVTNYQVQSSPGSAGCLVPATQTQCTISGLTDGTRYDFEVRALNGGGWGPWLDAGSATPGPVVEPSIVISGTRGDVRGRPGIIVTGTTTGLDEGSILRPWIRLPGQTGLSQGSARITVADDGDFTWQRRTGKRIVVEIRTLDGDVRSDRITIAAR